MVFKQYIFFKIPWLHARPPPPSWQMLIQLLESPCPLVRSLVRDKICCIIDTCIIPTCMHNVYMHHGYWIHSSWIHASHYGCMHHVYMHYVYTHHVYMHHANMLTSITRSCIIHTSYMYRALSVVLFVGNKKKRIMDTCIMHPCIIHTCTGYRNGMYYPYDWHIG